VAARQPTVTVVDAISAPVRKAGCSVSQQHAIVVRYDDMVVGEYAADLLVGAPSSRN